MKTKQITENTDNQVILKHILSFLGSLDQLSLVMTQKL